jgi:20S proteasome alpha/beta subunit
MIFVYALVDRCHRYQGHVSAALVLGGVDVHGPHLYSIFPHGSTQRLPYVTMGSGSLAAMAVFESRYVDSHPSRNVGVGLNSLIFESDTPKISRSRMQSIS